MRTIEDLREPDKSFEQRIETRDFTEQEAWEWINASGLSNVERLSRLNKVKNTPRRNTTEREELVRYDLAKIDSAFNDPRIARQLGIVERDARAEGFEAADAEAAGQRTALTQVAQDRGVVGSSMAKEANEDRVAQLLGQRIQAAAGAADMRRELSNGLDTKRQDLRQGVAQARLGSGENTDLLTQQLHTYLSSDALAGDNLVGDLANAGASWVRAGNKRREKQIDRGESPTWF